MVFKNGVENLGSTQLGDTSMVKIETLVEDKKLLEDPPRTINGASTTTGFEEQNSPDTKTEKVAPAQANIQNVMMLNNDLDRKWVQYVNKIFNALNNMDK